MLEAVLRELRRRPWMGLVFLWWLRRGVVPFKRMMLRAHIVDPAKLPWRQDVIAFLREQKAAGRRVVLATASNIAIAQVVAEHLALFDHVIGTDQEENLRGVAKVRAIKATLNVETFDYIGDSAWDLAVWRASTEALLVSPTVPIEREARKHGNVTRVFRLDDEPYHVSRMVWRTIRPGGAAIVAGGLVLGKVLGMHPLPWTGTLLLAMGAACGWAALSIGRDLVSVQQDREHPKGKLRPLAAGHWALLAAIRTAGWLAGLAVAAAAAGLALSWRAGI